MKVSTEIFSSKISHFQSLAKEIDGKPTGLDSLPATANMKVIRKVSTYFLNEYRNIFQIYQIGDPQFNEESLSDHIITRIVTKDFVS